MRRTVTRRAVIRRAVVLVLAPALVLSLGGCALVEERLNGPGDREMTTWVPRARSFYEKSKVMMMGTTVGTVDRVQMDEGRDRVRIDFRVRGDVPLPDGVNASIVPLNLVGERHLVLHPAWKPGMPKETGNEIPMKRTSVPVETDDALEAFTNLADALDPTKVREALGTTARSFEGNGKEFNAALEQGARLTSNIASQDQELVQVAKNMERLAGVVRGREEVLGSMIRDFGTASRVLARERGELQRLVRGVLDLSKHSDRMIERYEEQLPYDIAVLTRLALSLRGNSQRLSQLLDALPDIGGALIQAYDPDSESLKLRFATNSLLRIWLKGIVNSDDVPCELLPPPNSNCAKEGG